MGKPDFTAADEIAKQRRAVKARRVLDEKQTAERQASSAADDAAREQRHSAAAKVLASLDVDARKAIADATRASVTPVIPLQTFPPDYQFADVASDVKFSRMGRLIGNAVPVRLGEVIGKAFVAHVAQTGSP